jgi:hypothetical protein
MEAASANAPDPPYSICGSSPSVCVIVLWSDLPQSTLRAQSFNGFLRDLCGLRGSNLKRDVIHI